MNTTVTPPNGNKREYISYAPYLWPSCKGIKNITDPETQCPYKPRDGLYNPDVRNLSDPVDSRNMVKDVLSLSIFYQLHGDENFAEKAVQLLDTWFVNEETSMLPEVIYGQIKRGPGEWKGREEGILDTRLYVYIPVAVRILEKSRAWNDNIDKGIRNWISDFSNWLMNSNLGKQAFKRSNNHATFYVAQLATYLEFSGRIDEARNLIRKFSETTFQNMILKSGEQPMESKRTKPYHYQCFNLEALTYIALLSQKINGTNLWEIRTKDGATIQNAVDYLIPLKNQDAGQEGESILLPALYKARDYYGDQSGKYANTISKFLKTTNGASEWWTIYSPKSLRDGNVKNSNGKSYNYDNYDSYSENSATSLFGTSLYAMLSFGLGVFFMFLY
ncbi:alginate lyase-domain-containing protein [Rhizophagus diaphanus]|nr:alginate lyase-domain-containing protein [Rhizophagus diaphanus] [Rhizophagus sp. MUCL 43196]